MVAVCSQARVTSSTTGERPTELAQLNGVGLWPNSPPNGGEQGNVSAGRTRVSAGAVAKPSKEGREGRC